jgi:hypothetical protein
MADNKDTPVPVGGIAVLLLLAAGVFVKHQWPLESSRPGDGELRAGPSYDTLDLNARLWEDPFAALVRLKKEREAACCAQPGARPPADPGVAELAGRLAQRKDVRVLGVLAYSSAYGNETEIRRRTRYAVLAGLEAAGYVPTLYDKIGYFRTRDPAVAPELVPYELFLREDGAGDIVLLWLAEEAFGEHLVANLNLLLDDLETAVRAKGAAKLRFGVIGPAGSAGLRAIADARPACERDARTAAGAERTIEFYSPNATAVDAAALPDPLRCVIVAPDGRRFAARMSVVSTVNTDADVLKALVAELRLRGVQPGASGFRLRGLVPGDDHVVLASEWDTDYGRNLPAEFVKAACALAGRERDPGCIGSDGHDPRWVTRVSYMRGLDGDARAPPRKPGDKDKAAGDADKAGGRDGEPVDRPAGNGQYDYLRRLADTVEQRTRVTFGRRDVAAVGVLGSDPYDKLLVLQALRPQFPKAIFFTTDLDARFVHPAEFEWTHNLLVGSGHGLELAENVQGRAPPFRDTYQTSAFLATKLALHPASFGDKRGWLRRWLSAPRVYEVGRSRAYAFQPRSEARADPGCADLASCADVREALPFFLAPGARSWIVVIGALLLAAVSAAVTVWLLRIYLRSFRESTDRIAAAVRSDPRCLYPALAIGLLAVAVALCVPFNGRGEPFSWTAGISIWPTEAIRLFALVLCLVFIRRMLRPVALAADDSDGGFFLAAPGASAVAPGAPPGYARINSWYDQYHDSPGEEVDAVTLWRQFRSLEQPWKRAARLWPQLVAYMVFFACLILAFRDTPNVPARGDFSRGVDDVMSFFCMLAFLLLLLLVIDVIRLGSALIRNLSTSRSCYPAGTIAQLRGELGLGPAHPDHYLCDLLDIRLIAAYTERINAFVYYPFVVLALLVAARSPIFDNWYTPPALALVFLYAFVATAVCAAVLQRAAARAREIAVGRVRTYLMHARGVPDPALTAQLEMMLAEIESARSGAFLPFTQQPLVRAILVALGSFGGLQLLEFSVARL